MTPCESVFFTVHCRNFVISQEKFYSKINLKNAEYIPLLEVLNAHLYHDDGEKYLGLKRNDRTLFNWGVSKYFDHRTSLFRAYLLTPEASHSVHFEKC